MNSSTALRSLSNRALCLLRLSDHTSVVVAKAAHRSRYVPQRSRYAPTVRRVSLEISSIPSSTTRPPAHVYV